MAPPLTPTCKGSLLALTMLGYSELSATGGAVRREQ